MNSLQLRKKSFIPIEVPTLVAIIFTFFLFYIDEGFYNFSWMLDFGNWIAFVIYVCILFASQVLLDLLLMSFLPRKIRTYLIPVIGIIFGLWFCFSVVFG